MFGMFGSGKIVAYLIGDALYSIERFSGCNLNKLKAMENYDLGEHAYQSILRTCGKRKKYTEIENLYTTWTSLIDICTADPSHSFSHKLADLKTGLSDFQRTRPSSEFDGLPSGLQQLVTDAVNR